MISFLKALPRHIRTAFVSIFRHFAMSLSASSAVTVTLILFSAFLIVAGNVSLFTDNIEAELRIHVVMHQEVVNDDAIAQVKKDIEDISGVKRATFSSKEEELEMMIKERGEDLAMYRGEENPLSNAFFVTVQDGDQIQKISEQIQALEQVDKTMYGGNSVSKLISILNSIRSGGLIFIILLTVLALYLISNAIKMTIYARNAEISIMRNVGAANWYIKVPFMIEGMLIGILGALIPCILTYFGYQYLYDTLNGQIVTAVFTLQPMMPFTLQVCMALTLFGMAVGFIGGFVSTTRYLRWKR